eukprot:scaffold1642_cov252-Pinguiococcus_pyrenoidosus.AAC.16
MHATVAHRLGERPAASSTPQRARRYGRRLPSCASAAFPISSLPQLVWSVGRSLAVVLLAPFGRAVQPSRPQRERNPSPSRRLLWGRRSSFCPPIFRSLAQIGKSQSGQTLCSALHGRTEPFRSTTPRFSPVPTFFAAPRVQCAPCASSLQTP